MSGREAINFYGFRPLVWFLWFNQVEVGQKVVPLSCAVTPPIKFCSEHEYIQMEKAPETGPEGASVQHALGVRGARVVSAGAPVPGPEKVAQAHDYQFFNCVAHIITGGGGLEHVLIINI